MMKTKKAAGLMLGAVLLMIPQCWAIAAEGPGLGEPAPESRPGSSSPPAVAPSTPRRNLKVATRTIGGIVLGVGVVSYLRSRVESGLDSSFCYDNRDPSCHADHFSPVTPVMLVSGLALLVLPSFWSDDPVSDSEKRSLAAASSPHIGISVASAQNGSGATFALSGRF
jgi:hypothetical protein